MYLPAAVSTNANAKNIAIWNFIMFLSDNYKQFQYAIICKCAVISAVVKEVKISQFLWADIATKIIRCTKNYLQFFKTFQTLFQTLLPTYACKTEM